jgi:hypothetical protein
MKQHSVSQGECLTSIAKDYGIPWRKIWDDGVNASLKEERKDPNILFPGDRLMIPDLEKQEKSGGTEAKHRYRVTQRNPSIHLCVRLRSVDGEETPIANKAYELHFDEGEMVTGSTDGSGMIEANLPPAAQVARIVIPDKNLSFPVKLGHLDPIDQLTGVQGRLNMLGYESGPIDGMMGPITEGAVRRYQTDHDLIIDGIPGPQTQGKLKEVFGS